MRHSVVIGVRIGVAAGGLGLVLLGCAERSVGGGGTSGGSETGATQGYGDSGSSAEVPEPTGGGTSGGTSGGTTGSASEGGSSETTAVWPDFPPSEFMCDIFTQDCGAGEKCVTWFGEHDTFAGTKCVDVSGERKPGESCTAADGGASGIDDCQEGARCFFLDDTNAGVCVALCTGSPDKQFCGEGAECWFSDQDFLNLCIPKCDPLLQECKGQAMCLAGEDACFCVVDWQGDMGAVNDPCEFANECDKGLACIESASASNACGLGSGGCCQPFCEFVEGQDGDCPNPDQKCVQWFAPMRGIPAGYEHVGVCRIPA